LWHFLLFVCLLSGFLLDFDLKSALWWFYAYMWRCSLSLLFFWWKNLTIVYNRDIIEMKWRIYAFFVFSKPILVDFDDNFCFSGLLCSLWGGNNSDRATQHANLAFWALR